MGLSSFGTLLKIGDGGGPETFTTIAEVRDIKGPKVALGTTESTNHSSPGGWREKLPTLLEAGPVEFEINFDPNAATHGFATGLVKDAVNRTLRNFQVVFPSSPAVTWSFSAYVVQVEPDEPVEGKISAAVILDITGQPTLA